MTEDIHQRISAMRVQFGNSLTIIGHHYQSDEIIRHVQISGDSLELSQKVASIESENIIFCGVHFMAESAALLARKGQKIFIPAHDANCVMAKMAPAALLDNIITKLNAHGKKVLPVAYVNTSLAVKAVVGNHGGTVCTSSNAAKIMRWALRQDRQVLFLPDHNLGRNTAKLLGLTPAEQFVIDVRGQGAKPEALNQKLLLWPGQCAIHARFRMEHVHALRKQYPGIKIAVHPECPPAIADAADAAGSTSFLIRFAAEAPDKSVIAIGTEANLVLRLAKQFQRQKTIIPLLETRCSDMAKTTPQKLLDCLESIAAQNGKFIPVRVAPELAAPARASLEKMLILCTEAK